MLSDTRKAVLEHETCLDDRTVTLDDVLKQFEALAPHKWNDRTWEAFVLNYLWRVCCDGVHKAGRSTRLRVTHKPSLRHRDVLIEAGSEDTDLPVHDTLIRFCAVFLDQEFADWHLPHRELGFSKAFLQQHSESLAPTRWFRSIRRECRRLLDADGQPLDSIDESLKLLGVTEDEQEAFLTQSLLALRGWAGMVWQMESNAEWASHPAPSGTLIE